jgi:hypothetical protein
LTEEKAAQAYLKKVVASINFLNKKTKKEAYKRGLDVLPEVMSLKKYASGPPIRKTRDIALQEFLIGVQRYLIGFYDDSIYHITLSVEMSLLIRLDEELPPEKKSEIHKKINSKNETPFSFTFGSIFNVCKGKDFHILTNKKIEERIEKIIETRNTHIHASNLTSASILSLKEVSIPEIDKGLKELELVEKTPMANIMMRNWLPHAKKLLLESRSTIDSLPCFEWCTRDKQRTQTQNNVNHFFNEQFASIDKIRNKQQLSEKLRIGLHSGEIIRSFSKDSYSKRKALETMQDAFEVLKEIGFLEES